jgi:hypothetical protein
MYEYAITAGEGRLLDDALCDAEVDIGPDSYSWPPVLLVRLAHSEIETGR